MKAVQAILYILVIVVCFTLLPDFLNNGSVRMTTVGDTTEMVTTDAFGNKQTCTTTIIGSQVISNCD